MCLAVPGKIIRITGDVAVLDYGSEQRTAKIVEGAYREGEYAIVQGGIVVLKVPEAEAEQALQLYQQAVSQKGVEP